LTARGSGSRAAQPVAKEVSHPNSEERDEPTNHTTTKNAYYQATRQACSIGIFNTYTGHLMYMYKLLSMP